MGANQAFLPCTTSLHVMPSGRLCHARTTFKSVHINCYERSYQLLRAFISIVTSLHTKWNEPTCTVLLHDLCDCFA